MDTDRTAKHEAQSVDDHMAAEIERRRLARPERRRTQQQRPATDRRKLCSYCFQPGDHPTPAHCLRALER